MVKNPPAVLEIWVRSLGQKFPWRRERRLPSPVFLPGESPRTEEPGGLQYMGKESDMTERLSTAQHLVLNLSEAY